MAARVGHRRGDAHAGEKDPQLALAVQVELGAEHNQRVAARNEPQRIQPHVGKNGEELGRMDQRSARMHANAAALPPGPEKVFAVRGAAEPALQEPVGRGNGAAEQGQVLAHLHKFRPGRGRAQGGIGAAGHRRIVREEAQPRHVRAVLPGRQHQRGVRRQLAQAVLCPRAVDRLVDGLLQLGHGAVPARAAPLTAGEARVRAPSRPAGIRPAPRRPPP
jgi:hypothetical protein